MRILITGATGLVGNILIKQALLDGYEVHFLTRNKAKLGFHKGIKDFYWNPNENEIDLDFDDSNDIELEDNAPSASAACWATTRLTQGTCLRSHVAMTCLISNGSDMASAAT